MQLQSQQLSASEDLLEPKSKYVTYYYARQTSIYKFQSELTIMGVSACTSRIPALLSVPLSLLSWITERKIFMQAEAGPACEL